MCKISCYTVVYAIFFSHYCVPGHDRYYNKYINVKRGGIGGVAMLLVGYVAISYLWEYDHISKKFRDTYFSCLGCSDLLLYLFLFFDCSA